MKNTIKIQRAINNITQEELAKLVGVSRQTINTIESGKYLPSTLLALKLATVLHITVEALFMLEKQDWEGIN
ncbi:putative transcriptional regulator [Chitinophaga niastensis]|uniref:Putative transcriptional regulator n=1 Tax=Chitinophaga niastensis TaxID=536980 RepID=A0A2P8HJF8_CHINA|nr:helix-turn-helix transcriptional regulator [Chitinophaga niastensis]PSL46310.1 putative transcriptional regulator [Chitinophaga niastensis]